jgi:hypothetical protein
MQFIACNFIQNFRTFQNSNSKAPTYTPPLTYILDNFPPTFLLPTYPPTIHLPTKKPTYLLKAFWT